MIDIWINAININQSPNKISLVLQVYIKPAGESNSVTQKKTFEILPYSAVSL